jgi:N-acylneuraminate cytidylyltransferase
MDRFVALIPARGGSKSIPRKNVKPLCGRPLIYWTLKAAQECSRIDSIFVATEDSEIRRIVEDFGFSKVSVVERGAHTATDSASTESVMMEFAANHEFDNIVLIQTTSPLLESYDLDNAIDKYTADKSDSLLSVVRQKRFIWQKSDSCVVPENYDIMKRPRRQEWEGFLVENGAFYITSRSNLLATCCRMSGKITHYEMSDETYFELDEPSDWKIVEELKMNRLHGNFSGNFNNINLLICDVDGVLTDGGMYYSSEGEVLKKFNARDGKGFEIIRKHGIKVMILTSEDIEIVRKRAEKLKVDFLYMGISNKKQLLEKFFKENPAFSFETSAYIGDDINDLPCLEKVFFSAVPLDAMPDVKRVSKHVCNKKGGEGCVREICDLLTYGRSAVG